jgi:hypothetical protein
MTPAATATSLARSSDAAQAASSGRDAVGIRPWPYPYRAMLAICSDLDETPDRTVYWDTMRFLNTTDSTSMGPGLGLDVANSIYFDMPPAQFAYWNTDDVGRAMVTALIQSGHIDCLHSFGDLATTRAHAGRALEELSRRDCALTVWVDHAVAPTNFGSDIMRGRGDIVGDTAYHADLTCGFGVQYVWRGRVTSAIGQDGPSFPRVAVRLRHPLASTVTTLKETAKRVLGRRGSHKYAMHGSNRALQRASLRDGRLVWEFMRANPHWAGVSRGDTADGLAEVLTENTLKRLVKREAMMVLYTHLGKIQRPAEPLRVATCRALRRLARFQSNGSILVTTTRRALDYRRLTTDLRVSSTAHAGHVLVEVTSPPGAPGSSPNPAGLTLYVPDRVRVTVTIDGQEISNVRHNPPDHTERNSVSVPWVPLEFPRL